MAKVGIPRALVYYQYHPMWKAFFEHLGAEVVVSEPTNRETVAKGSARVVAETCLPAKVFCGHVISLVGKCDYMFIPSIRSLKESSYNCSKFLGLPDMVRAAVPECPPILDTNIEIPRGKREIYFNILSLGRHFTQNPLKLKRAVKVSLKVHRNYRRLMWEEKLMPIQAIERLEGRSNGKPRKNGEIEIALIGHPYSLYDDHINHRLIHKLEKLKVKVLTPEMVPEEELERQSLKLVGRHYWTYEHEVSGAGAYYLERGVDGIIGVMPFGCGPDSLMMDLVRHEAKRNGNIPFMLLSIDEHTAEAGLMTRLEAFVDMVHWQKRRKS